MQLRELPIPDSFVLPELVEKQEEPYFEGAANPQKTHRRYEAMVALHETSLHIIAQLDTYELLDTLMERGALLLNAQASTMFLFERTTQTIHNVANYNNWCDWANITLRPGDGIIGQVILTGKPIIMNDYSPLLHISDAPLLPELTRKMGAPLRWQNQIIGGVIMTRDFQSQPFDDEDLWLLGQFADLASIAVKNAILFSQVKQCSAELEQKVDARTLDLSRAKEEIAAQAEQLRSLLAKTIHIQEEERSRIARDIHDGALQLINAVRYQIQAAELVARQDLTAAAQDKLLAARESLDEIEEELRDAIGNLRPLSLDLKGLGPTVRGYVSRFQQLCGIDCTFEISGAPMQMPLNLQACIYRIVQEALSNVTEHAQATAASVVFDYQPSMIWITVDDNGSGIDAELCSREVRPNGNHFGLLSMRERAKSLGGDMDVESTPGCGTRLRFWFPINCGESE
jgi:signal transduction histidine kinase